MLSTCWQGTVSTQISHTVKRFQSELCTAQARVPKTFPVELRPGSRPPLRPCVRDRSKVLKELSKANITMDASRITNTGKFEMDLSGQTEEITCRSGGLDLADQFILKYPRSFTMRFSDHDTMSNECLISDTCLNQDYVKGYEIFLSMKRKKKTIPLDKANKLLDLFCYHGYKNTKNEHKIISKAATQEYDKEDEADFTAFYKPTVTLSHCWSTENAASELFTYMEDKDDLSYNLMIQSIIKDSSGDPKLLNLAFTLYEEMKCILEYKPSIDTYKALIYTTRYNEHNRVASMTTLLRTIFSEFFIKPDADLFVVLLDVLSCEGSDSMQLRTTTKEVMDEFLNSNITSSFGDFFQICVQLTKTHMKKYSYTIFHKIITTRKDLLTVDKGDIEDYRLLLHLVDDYSLMMSPQEVLAFLDYITDNNLVHMIGERLSKAHFAIRLLTKYNETDDVDTLQQVYTKLDHVWKDDISTQMICATVLLKRTRISREKNAENLISLAQKLDELDKQVDQENDIILRCDSLYHYSNSMWMQCRSYVKGFDSEADMDTLKRLHEINIKLMLKMQENSIVPNQNTITNLVFTSLYTGDIINAWRLLNLYGEYEHVYYRLALSELVKVSKVPDSPQLLTARTIESVKMLQEQHNSIRIKMELKNMELNESCHEIL